MTIHAVSPHTALTGQLIHEGSSSSNETSPRIHGEWSVLGALHNTGQSGESTFIRRGRFLTNELYLDHEQNLNEDWLLANNIHLRRSTDPRTDKRHDVHLLGFTSEIYNPLTHLYLGDVYADFSNYTLQQSLRGAHLTHITDERDIQLAIGQLFEEDEALQFARYAGGVKADQKIFQKYGVIENLWVGYQFSATEDAHDSIESKTNVLDPSNRVGSVTSRFKLLGHTQIDLETAKSWFDADTSPGNLTERQMGTAVRLSASTKVPSGVRNRFHYEWVSADFQTLSGSAAPDRVNISDRLDFKLSQVLRADFLYRIMYDKLNKSVLNKRTVTQSPKASLQWTPQAEDWYLKNYYSRIYFETRDRFSSDDESGQLDYESRELGFEQEFSREDFFYTTGYSLREQEDDFQKSNNNLINGLFASIRTTRSYQSVEATSSVRYQADYEHRGKEDGRDLVQSLNAELALKLSERVSFNQRYSAEFGSFLAENADSTRFNAYLNLEYRFSSKLDRMLYISFERTDYAHEEAYSRFNESVLEIKHVLRF